MKKHSGALARRYGTALFETLIELHENKTDNFSFEKSIEQIFSLSQVFTKEVINTLSLPSLTLSEKMQTLKFILEKTLGNNQVAPQIISFIELLMNNQRLSEIQTILNYFFAKYDEFLGIARATVVSARPLHEGEKQEFETQLTKVLNKKVIFKNEQDASLKSGFVLKIGNLSIDASLRSRLNSLKELFI